MQQMILDLKLVVLVVLLVILSLVTNSLEYKEYKLEYGDLCSPVTKRKVRLSKDEASALIVTQSRLYDHRIEWNVNFVCKFEVQTAFPRNGGLIAVIQYLNFRKNYTNDECIDYIQFRPKDGPYSDKYCGAVNASIAMNKHFVDPTKQLAYEAAVIDYRGEMNVYISISKKPLEHYEHSNLKVVFTSYKHCIKDHSIDLLPCSDKLSTFCIYKDFFKDDIINCPYIGCTDEGGCVVEESKEKHSIGDKVLAGSISALFFIFFLFVLCIWSCKKHQVLCWSEDFANPSTTVAEAEANATRTSRVMEMNEQTGARLATAPNVPTAPLPPEDDKDLPPSYESLFPDSR